MSLRAPWRRPPRSMKAVSGLTATTVPETRAPGSSVADAFADAAVARIESTSIPSMAAWKSSSRSSSRPARRFGTATRFEGGRTSAKADAGARSPRRSRRGRSPPWSPPRRGPPRASRGASPPAAAARASISAALTTGPMTDGTGAALGATGAAAALVTASVAAGGAAGRTGGSGVSPSTEAVAEATN